jgi:hypothetical protein
VSIVAKRTRFSRWRRLPGVFRTGQHRPIEKGNELDRIILYLPARLLDLAEALAEKSGAASVQEHCSRLLAEAIENDRARQKVDEFESRRGPLQGLREIANDPDYLTEWQKRHESRQDPVPMMEAQDDRDRPRLPAPDERLEGEHVDSPKESDASEPAQIVVSGDSGSAYSQEDSPGDAVAAAVPVSAPGVHLKPTVLLRGDGSAMEILSRHVGWIEDHSGFLPCLRRGIAPPVDRISELTATLRQIEAELRSAPLIERRLAYALHRLSLESQVLLTEAWPGVFNDHVVAGIRLVQEAVERILSGEDVRYYPVPSTQETERPH